MSATEPGRPEEQGAPPRAAGPDPTQPTAPPAVTAYPAGYTPSAPAPRTNAMAILSMVSSILGLTLLPIVGSIVGVVTGHIARRQIRESGEQGLGPATAGVAIGWVGIALLVIAIVVLVVAVVVFGANVR